MKNELCILNIILLVFVLLTGNFAALASSINDESPIEAQKKYYVASDNVITLLEYGHVEKNAFEGEGFYNDALYGLLAMAMIVEGNEACK